MQARENSMTDIMQRRLQHLMYPKESGYQNEAGGLMENLRTLKIESSKNNKQLALTKHYITDNNASNQFEITTANFTHPIT